jgi:Polyketide cyclase / dehydrase and lipid transport
MSDTIEEMKDAVEDKAESAGNNGNGGGLGRKILIPAAAGVGTLAATVAARKGPDLFRDKLLPMLENKGGDEAAKIGENAASKMGGKGVLGSVAGKALGGGGGGGGGGREKTRRLPIQRWTDVAVPVQDAYDKWTEFEEFPKFMHRVLNVEKKDDKHLEWQEKIWFSTRQWEGEITDRRKNDRIAWKTTKGTSHSGIVSFHKLDTNLTRVLVTMDFHPSGMIEKMASGLRFVKRAVEADLARFKAYCELGDAKGLEYAQPGELDDKGDGEDTDNGDDEPRAESNGSNGKSNEDLERSRQERAEKREERRGS